MPNTINPPASARSVKLRHTAQFLAVWSSRPGVDTVARRLSLSRSKTYVLMGRAGILRDFDGALRVAEDDLARWLATTRRSWATR